MDDRVLAALDFEASSLGEEGFPIEVACVVGTKTGIHTEFSTLIRPDPHWKLAKGWSAASERVHGIVLPQLKHGMAATPVCDLLNELLRGLTVVVDGGTFDEHWLARLLDDRQPRFTLDHLSGIDPRAFMAAKRGASPRHRALPDARWLWAVVAETRFGSRIAD